MLPSNERLTRREITEILSNKGIFVVYNQLGTLKYNISTKPGLSVVTSGKHEKTAVKRNKIRRRIYTLFRSHKENIRGVMYISKNSYTLQYSEIQKLFHGLLAKISK